MNGIEISKALALAIGWPEDRLETLLSGLLLVRVMPSYSQLDKFFDYRDWNVIGPIAVKFDCFQLVASQSGG